MHLEPGKKCNRSGMVLPSLSILKAALSKRFICCINVNCLYTKCQTEMTLYMLHISALQSIFIGSADIRVQLPEDSKRFDDINADFGDLMKVDSPSLIDG